MARARTHVIGRAEMRRAMRGLPGRVREVGEEAVAEAAQAVRAEVQRTVRVDTGNLRQSVDVRTRSTRRGPTAEVGWWDDADYYARFNEFGTSSIAADPVLTSAAERERRRFPQRVQAAGRRRL